MRNVQVVILGLGSYLTGDGQFSKSTVGLVRELSESGVDCIHIDDFEKMRTIQGDGILKQAGNYLFVEVVDSISDERISIANVRPNRYLNMRTVLDIVDQDFGAHRRYDASSMTVSDSVRDITALRDAYQMGLSVVGASYDTVMSDASAEFTIQHNMSAQVVLTVVDFFNGQPINAFMITSAAPDYVTIQFTEPRIARIKAKAVADWKI